jgi:hypothetical protein
MKLKHQYTGHHKQCTFYLWRNVQIKIYVITDIEKLQARIKALEERLKTRDESRLSNDLKVLLSRLDLVERKFQDETGNLKLLQHGLTVSGNSNIWCVTHPEITFLNF